MPTNFQFSPAQINEIARLRTEALARGLVVGAFKPVYDYLSQQIQLAKYTGADAAEVERVRIWLLGGSQINNAAGAFSSVIREYNRRQGQLRGLTFTDAQLQTASNEVANRVVDQILNSGNPAAIGKVPTIQEIGDSDLNGVRDTLFPGNVSVGTELNLNQAWPGILVLGQLGGQFSERLLQVNQDDPVNKIDSLLDIKNLLFAWDAWKFGRENTSPFSLTLTDIVISNEVVSLGNFLDIFSNRTSLDLVLASQKKTKGVRSCITTFFG